MNNEKDWSDEQLKKWKNLPRIGPCEIKSQDSTEDQLEKWKDLQKTTIKLKDVTTQQQASILKFMNYNAGPLLDQEDIETNELLSCIISSTSSDMSMNTEKKIQFLLQLGLPATGKDSVEDIDDLRTIKDFVFSAYIKVIRALKGVEEMEKIGDEDLKKQRDWVQRITTRWAFWTVVKKLMESTTRLYQHVFCF